MGGDADAAEVHALGGMETEAYLALAWRSRGARVALARDARVQAAARRGIEPPLTRRGPG